MSQVLTKRKKLQDIANRLSNNQQRTQIVDGSGNVIGATANALDVNIASGVSVTVDSEFPAAAVLTDNFANPTSTSVASMLMAWDTATWDRVQIGGGTEAAALRVTLASDSTGLVSVDDNGAALSIDIGGVPPQMDDTDKVAVSLYASTAGGGAGAGTLNLGGGVAASSLLVNLATDVGLPAGTSNIGISGSNVSRAVSITRAANATLYTINDVMNNGTDTTPLAFTTLARANDLRGWIVGGVCVSSAASATLPNIDLLLFSSTFTIVADNLAFAPTYAQMQTYLGKIRFSTWVSRGVRSDSDGSVEQPFIFVPAAGTRIVYGVPVMQNGYTPVSGETLQFSVNVDQY